jgi:TPP-dependent pyruvate/acetoin dehydrogenase alpha subunit
MVIPEFRGKDEIGAWRKRDPIVRFEDWLEKEAVANRADFERLRAEIHGELDKAEAFAKAAPYPNADAFRSGLSE